jgi:hypothetical protein
VYLPATYRAGNCRVANERLLRFIEYASLKKFTNWFESEY